MRHRKLTVGEKIVLGVILIAPIALLVCSLSGCDEGTVDEGEPYADCVAACWAVNVHSGQCTGYEAADDAWDSCEDKCMEDCNLDQVLWCVIGAGCDITDQQRFMCWGFYECYTDED